jgi:signal transduction histidine kinase
MAITKFVDFATKLADLFIPESISSDREAKKLARVFLYSHLCGPFIGSVVPLAIYIFDPTPGYKAMILLVSIFSFWIFPFLLKYTGAYKILALISIENLTFCILWSCFCYGGVRSPTLAWLLIVPLLSFLYVGPSTFMRLFIVGQFIVSAAIFYAANLMFVAPVVTMSQVALQSLGIVSTVAATVYVAMMAMFYASALASQVELKAEIDGHLRTTSELLAATESARRSSAAKGEFIAKMSHELRTPLNAVIGYSEILLDEAEVDQDAQAAADLKRIHQAGVHLLKLVNEILDLSRLEAGKMEVSEELVDCGDLLRSLAPRFEASARANGNSIVVDAERASGHMLVDSAKLRQMLEQLIENAIAFTRDGEVAMTAERGAEGDSVRFTVSDTGCGIAPERLDGFFDRLETVEETDDRAGVGAGVGLLLCKRLGELLEAKLSIESELGKGTRVTIVLPARAADVETHVKAEEGRRRLSAVAEQIREDNNPAQESVAYAQSAVG